MFRLAVRRHWSLHPHATSKYRVKQSNMTTSHSRQSNISWYKGAVFALPASKTHQYSKSFALWSDFCIYLWVFPYSVHGGLSAQGAEVCSYIACSSLCKLRQVHTGTNGHARTQNRQDVLSLLWRGSSNDDLKERGETQSLKDVYIYLFFYYVIIRTSLSNLPGLRRAGSKLSGRLVAPTMRKRSDWFIPSISVRSWATRRFSGADEPLLLGHRESSSSKNSTHGPSSAADRARSNTARNFSSLSPGLDPTTWKKHSQLLWIIM